MRSIYQICVHLLAENITIERSLDHVAKFVRIFCYLQVCLMLQALFARLQAILTPTVCWAQMVFFAWKILANCPPEFWHSHSRERLESWRWKSIWTCTLEHVASVQMGSHWAQSSKIFPNLWGQQFHCPQVGSQNSSIWMQAKIKQFSTLNGVKALANSGSIVESILPWFWRAHEMNVFSKFGMIGLYYASLQEFNFH